MVVGHWPYGTASPRRSQTQANSSKPSKHLRALLWGRAIRTPQHTGRKLMNRILEPPPVAVVAVPIIIPLLDG
jgi:hypothetical protein